jgi:ABC-type transport system involved in multi-copper enzyme maturation permease subunit
MPDNSSRNMMILIVILILVVLVLALIVGFMIYLMIGGTINTGSMLDVIVMKMRGQIINQMVQSCRELMQNSP